MKRILFLFGKDGKPFKIIEDAQGIGYYGKTAIVYGYDNTTICKLNSEDIKEDGFIDLNDNETLDYNTINSAYDIERYNFKRWKTAQDAIKAEKVKRAQNELEFLETRHDRLLELIKYSEKELEKTPYFSKQWEKAQRKIIILENQLRSVDAKREKAYSIIYG